MVEWCAPCEDEDVKVVAAQVLNGVPVCKGCALSFEDIPEALAAYRVKVKVEPVEEPETEPEPEKTSEGRGRKKGSNYKVFDRQEAAKLLKEGASVRDAAEETGLAKNTVLEVRKEVATELPALCECGRPLGHRGWCKGRLKQSPERQETLNMMHKRQRKIVETEEIEVTTHGPERDSILRIALPGGGGELALTFQGHLFSITREDRNFMFSIIDRMREYAQLKGVPLPVKPFSILGTIDGVWMSDLFSMLDQKEQEVVIEWLKEATGVIEERHGASE